MASRPRHVVIPSVTKDLKPKNVLAIARSVRNDITQYRSDGVLEKYRDKIGGIQNKGLFQMVGCSFARHRR
jgi:hypothetical protein